MARCARGECSGESWRNRCLWEPAYLQEGWAGGVASAAARASARGEMCTWRVQRRILEEQVLVGACVSAGRVGLCACLPVPE